MDDYSYLGSGKIYLREIGATTGFLEVGNCSALNFAISEDAKELKDFTKPGGGTKNEVRRIQSVECSFTMHDLEPQNLARALYGSASAVASVAVTNVALGLGYLSAFLPFANSALSTPAPVVRATNGRLATTRANSAVVALNAYLVPAAANTYFYKVTVAGTTGAAPPTFPTTVGETVVDGTATLTCMGKIVLVANTDYELRAGGVYLLPAASFTAGEAVESDYTKAATDVVQALTSSGKEYEIFFAGLNEARSGKESNVNAYRVKIGAAQNLSLLGEDYAALEVTGKLLADTTKVGAGVSQYFKAEIVR